MIDGRLDFRGLSAPDLKLVHVPVVHPVNWRDLDLSGATLSDLFLVRNGTIEGCRFDRADCRNWGLFGGSIRASSFAHADLRGAMMGKGTSWHDTDLTAANLGGTSSENSRFVRCRFDHAKLRRRMFESDHLIECSFAGLVDDCQFGGEDAPSDLLQGVDFSAAILRFARFWGQDLSGVIPPASDEHVVIREPRCVLERLLREFDANPEHPMAWQRGSFEITLLELGPRQPFMIGHLADLSPDETAPGGQDAADILRRLEADCLSAA